MHYIFFQKSCKLFLVFIATSLTVWSFALDSPIREILGDTGCWILFFGYVCHVTKNVLGGTFMALYRIVCIKKTDITTISNSHQRMIKILCLEFIFFILMVGLAFVGNFISGTGLVLAFCHGHSMIMGQIIGNPNLNVFYHQIALKSIFLKSRQMVTRF